MVREPKIRDASDILRAQMAVLGFTLPVQKSLDIVAQMKGYAGYQMYCQHHPHEKKSKASLSGSTFVVGNQANLPPVAENNVVAKLLAEVAARGISLEVIRRGLQEVGRAGYAGENTVEHQAHRLAEHFGLHEEWPRFCRDDWKYEVENGDTNLGYWDWCVHQAEADEDILFHLEEAFILNVDSNDPEKSGWWWLTNPDWRFLMETGSQSLPGVKLNGPFNTEKGAKEDLAAGHPLAEQRFLGTVRRVLG